MSKERVQKIMAQADIGSRRKCEEIIRQGRVRVNGEVIEVGTKAGVTAIIQPGGSKGDEQAIEAADKAGATMVFTGVRHFKH